MRQNPAAADPTTLDRRLATHSVVLVGFALVSFAYFGVRLLPHPGRFLVGQSGLTDPWIFVWSFAWWPHAILAGTNPFVSHAVYAPVGIDLAWVTSVPGLAVAFAPLTLLVGPAVSYNVAAILLPAFSAFAAYLLCDALTGSAWASVVGGYLYGFSSYVLAHQLAGHLFLTGAFLPPLLALAVLRYVRGELGARGLAWRIGLILAFQSYISIEVATTLVSGLVAGLIVAFALVPTARPRVRSLLAPVLAGGGLAAVLAAPLLYYALSAVVPFTIGYPWDYSADLLNLVVPTQVAGLGGSLFGSLSSRFPGDETERLSYLGLPALLIILLLLARRPWHASTRVLVAGFAVATVVSFGTALYVGGRRIVWLPWSLVTHWPVLDDLLPDRIALYATLCAAALVAIWVASTPGRSFTRPFVLPVLAIVALLPPLWTDTYVQDPPQVAFFSTGEDRNCLPPNETLLVFPFARFGDSILWQAESGFWFSIAEGTLAATDNMPTRFTYNTTISALLYGPLSAGNVPPTMTELRSLAVSHHVDRIVSALDATPLVYPDARQMRTFGRVENEGGALVAPACGSVSLIGNTGR